MKWVRKRQAGGRVDGCCQSAIGFSIWWISPQGSKRKLDRDPVPSSIPSPDNSRSVSTAPLTATGWWLVTTGVMWRALLKCQIKAAKKLFYWTYHFEWIWVMKGFAFWLYCSSCRASHTFKLQQNLWEDTQKAIHIYPLLEKDLSRSHLLHRHLYPAFSPTKSKTQEDTE